MKNDPSKKRKRLWVNLKDKSQRWSHEKKIRDIRARAFLKKQCRREERKGGCGDSRICATTEPDPDAFLEKLCNPFYKKKENREEPAGQPQTKETSVLFKGRGRATERWPFFSAKTWSETDDVVAEGVNEEVRPNSRNSSVKRTDKGAGASAHRDNLKRSFRVPNEVISAKEREDEDEDGNHDTEKESADSEWRTAAEVTTENDINEEETMSCRRRKSRRRASYSLHSGEVFKDDTSPSVGERKKGRRGRDFMDNERTHSTDYVPAGLIRQETKVFTSVRSRVPESLAASVDKKNSSFVVNETSNTGDSKATQERPRLPGASHALKKVQHTSVPEEKVFYPYKKAMQEAARRRAALEEERKRWHEEKEKANRERDFSRKRRARERRQLVARTSKGQPVMGNVMQLLLRKIKSSV